MKRAMLAIGLVAFLIGCAHKRSPGLEYHVARAGDYHDVVAALNKAEAQWVSVGVTSYSYHIRRGGMFGGSVFKAIYRNGSCRASHLRDVGASSNFSCDENSMPQLFAAIRKAVASKDSDIFVSFDHELGYVMWFSIEPNAGPSDQGWGVEISHFKVLK